MGHYVYKYVLHEKIIYIGKNDTNLTDRIYAHEHNKKDPLYGYQKKYSNLKIYFTEVENKIQSELLESLLIDKYKPVLNKAKKYDGVGDLFQGIIEPEFKLLVTEKKSIKSSLGTKRIYQNSYTRSASNKESYEDKVKNMIAVMQYVERFFDINKNEYHIQEKMFPYHWRNIDYPNIVCNHSDGSWVSEAMFESIIHSDEDGEVIFKIKSHITKEQVIEVKAKYKEQLSLIEQGGEPYP